MTVDVMPTLETDTVTDSRAATPPEGLPEIQKPPLISLAGVVRGTTVEARNALIGGVVADEFRLERGFARTVFAGEEAELHKAGAQLVIAGGDISVEQGGACLVAARRVEVGERGTVVFALTPSLAVTGGRVIFARLAGLALLVGLGTAVLAAVGSRRRQRA